MKLRRVVRFALVALLAVVVSVSALGVWVARGGRPLREGERRLAGLAAPVDVRFDAWGVPAVAAGSTADAMFALGWLHANDRLFQMELTRRAAVGRLAELFGERAAAHDRRVVRLGFRGALRRLAIGVSPATRATLEAYSAGVNAWLEERDGDLPPEFRLLRRRPEPWRPEDSLAVLFVMARQLQPITEPNEEELLALLGAFGPEVARQLAIDPEAEIVEETVEVAREMAEGAKRRLEARAEGADLGSNNWVVAPERSRSGTALLANDPHLGLGLPGVWYQARIESPEYDVAGMTIPGAPGVVLGRSATAAWGCTNLYVDDVDLFVERVDPTGTKVLRGEEWVPIAVEQETLTIDGATETVEARSTDRGAFLAADPETGLPARSIAWTGRFPADQIAALTALARATGVADLREQVAPFVFPPQNLVVATAAGEIAWTPIGRGPRRFGWNGRFPVPAWRAEFGWDGLVETADNPLLVDPPTGEISTANSLLPIERPSWFSQEFDTPHRLERIRDRLATRTDWTPETLLELQGDVTSHWARELVAAIAPERLEGDAAKAQAALVAWDGAMAPSGPAALFALFERELLRRTFDDEAKEKALARFGNRKRLQALAAGRLDARFWDDVATPAPEERTAIVGAALAAAWSQAVARWGEQTASWPYAALHRLTLNHPLGSVPLVGRLFERGPFDTPGSSTTVYAMGGPWRGDAIDVSYGPSMRFVTDAAEPDRSWAAMPGGQSGHPFDRHYDDRLAPFLDGQAQPAPFTHAAVERATTSRLRLIPIEEN